MTNLYAIVAKSINNVIGINGEIPWKLPEDMKHFKKTTEFHYVIMGRKTVESLPPGGLPNRKIIALTRNKNWSDKRCLKVFHDIDSLLYFVEANIRELFFVAGGSEIYEQLLPFVEMQIVSEVNEVIKLRARDNPDNVELSMYPRNYEIGFSNDQIKVLSNRVVVKYLKQNK